VAVLFPAKESDREAHSEVEPSALEGIVVLDGHGRKPNLVWRNPWLLKLQRLRLPPMEPSIYGSLRAEPKRDTFSTLESVPPHSRRAANRKTSSSRSGASFARWFSASRRTHHPAAPIEALGSVTRDAKTAGTELSTFLSFDYPALRCEFSHC